MLEVAEKLFEDMKKDAAPNIFTYNILMDLRCRYKKVEAAFELRNAMEKAGLFPNINIVNLMIDRLAKAGNMYEACSILEGMDHKLCAPDAVTHCSLIDGLGRHKRVDDAYRLLEKMLDSGLKPNAVIYTSLIKNFFDAGRTPDGHTIYREMLRSNCSPDLTLLNTYMDCVFKVGETEKGRARKVNKAFQLLEEMMAKGCDPTVVTYGCVIVGLAKIDRLDEAYMLFEGAKSVGLQMNVILYSSLIDGYAKVGKINEAYLIMEEMMKKRLTPNVFTWNCLLDGLMKAEEVNEALILFKSLASMITGLARAGNINEAHGFFKKFKAKGGVLDAACYNAMIEALSIGNRAGDAFKLFEETRRKGFSIHSKTCVVLLDSLQRAECLEQAAIVGAVLKETAKAHHASKSWFGSYVLMDHAYETGLSKYQLSVILDLRILCVWLVFPGKIGRWKPGNSSENRESEILCGVSFQLGGWHIIPGSDPCTHDFPHTHIEHCVTGLETHDLCDT
ncbi:Pentatricopeptide repeat-containing protein [Drosera capensis]